MVALQHNDFDRTEREVRLIHTKAEQLRITPELVRRLHKLCQQGIVGDFTVSELERFCPGISRDHLRRLLKEMKAAGRVTCLGRGPGAKWRKAKEGHNPERGS